MHGSGCKGTGLLLSIPMSGGFFTGAEDMDVALGLFWALEGESSDGGRLDSKCGGSDF
jgi:hypothetical protein